MNKQWEKFQIFNSIRTNFTEVVAFLHCAKKT